MQDILKNSDKTRVLINGLHAKSGGGITYLRNVLPLISEDPRLEIHLFLHVDQFETFPNLGDGIYIHLLDFPTGLLRLLLWEQFILPIAAKMIAADVVFSPANYGPFTIRNQVILLQNATAVGRREWRIARRLYWITLAAATRLSLTIVKRAIAVSEYAAQSIAPSWIRKKVQVVHHGVSNLFRSRQESDYSKRDDFLLMVADIYVQKNLHTVIDALAKIRETHPNVRLLIAGSILDRAYYNQLCLQIKRLKISDNIVFLGSHSPEKICELYQQCRVMIFASTVETFGFPLVEAMASGCPVISSNAAAMPEVAGDGVLYFDPYDDQTLASLIEKVLLDDSLCRDLSQRAANRAKAFSWPETAAKTASILKDAAAQP